MRKYVNAAFDYVARAAWDASLLHDYLQLIERIPLNPENLKIPDGLRYHVMDVWVDELDRVDREKRTCPVQDILGPVKRLERDGMTRAIRKRAKETLGDERLRDWDQTVGRTNTGEEVIENNDAEDEWEGLSD